MKLVLFAPIEVESAGTVHLILPAALVVVYETDRDGRPANGSRSGLYGGNAGTQAGLENTKIGTRNAANIGQSREARGRWCCDEPTHWGIEAQRNVFKITKKEKFTWNQRETERSSQPVHVVARLIIFAVPEGLECTVGGIKPAVLEIVIDAAMNLVCAGANDGVEVRSTRMTEHRAVLILHEAELMRCLIRYIS